MHGVNAWRECIGVNAWRECLVGCRNKFGMTSLFKQALTGMHNPSLHSIIRTFAHQTLQPFKPPASEKTFAPGNFFNIVLTASALRLPDAQ